MSQQNLIKAIQRSLQNATNIAIQESLENDQVKRALKASLNNLDRLDRERRRKANENKQFGEAVLASLAYEQLQKRKASSQNKGNLTRSGKKSKSGNNKPRSTAGRKVNTHFTPKGFRLVNVPGDGDCLYHAVTRAIQETYGRTVHTFKSMPEFRDDLIQWIQNKKPIHNVDRQGVRRIRAGGWGEEYEVAKIAAMYGDLTKGAFCINVYNARPNVPEEYRSQVFSSVPLNQLNSNRRCKKTIYLHNSGASRASDHFQYMMKNNK
jgi:hypothetical protein